MGIVLIFMGCFLLYAKSKHFPGHLATIGEKVKQKPILVKILGYLLFAISIGILATDYGFWTGPIIFFITLMFSLTLTILLLPLNKKFAYVLTLLSIIVLLTEYFI